MYLGKINPVSEGIWSFGFLCILSAFTGPEIWTASPLGIQNNKIILLFFFFGGAFMTYQSLMKMLEKAPDKMDVWLKSRFTILFVVLTILVHLLHPSYYDYSYIYVMTFNVSKITIMCMLAHSSSRNFQPVRFINLSLAIIYVSLLLLSIFGTDVTALRLLLLLGSLADFSIFAYVVCTRLAELLEIRVFSVKPGSAKQVIETNMGNSNNLESENFKKVENHNDSQPNDTI